MSLCKESQKYHPTETVKCCLYVIWQHCLLSDINDGFVARDQVYKFLQMAH